MAVLVLVSVCVKIFWLVPIDAPVMLPDIVGKAHDNVVPAGTIAPFPFCGVNVSA